MSTALLYWSSWAAAQGSAASAAWATTVFMPPTLETTAATASSADIDVCRALPVLSDGSQALPAGGSEGDLGAGGDQGDPKGEPRRPPLEPLHLHGQHAHACWASSLTATLCLPQVGHRSAGPLVFERIRSVHWLRPAFAHASVPIIADQSERPCHLSLEFVAHEVPGPFLCMIKY